MPMNEAPITLTATGSISSAGTTVLVAARTKQWGWRPQLTGIGTGGTGTTVVDSGAPFSGSNAHVGWRVRTTDSDGTEQNGEITAETTTTLTCSGASFSPSPANGDAYQLDPPVGYRPLVVAYLISVGSDWAGAGTVKLESVNTVGTTTLETINLAATTAVTIPVSQVERYGAVHGNLQFTTSQNGTVNVEVEYRWVKIGSVLQYD